jgi:mannose-6-phosphate isomerase
VIRRLTGVVQPYAWGSPVFIPELLGNEPTGEPQAELWLGAHPSAPSTVDGTPLNELVAADPEGVVGQAPVAAFGSRLPFLMKVLAADQPLSLQAHPSRTQAEQGFAREQASGVAVDSSQRVYRDDWPKPEVLCALTETEALCGFRDPEETYALFERLGVGSATDLVLELSDRQLEPASRLSSVFQRLLETEDRQVIDDVVEACTDVGQGDRGDADRDFALFARTGDELGSHYPGDPGVLAALLMNRVFLRPNDALFMPAGNLHAYLKGGGVEIMANSDNVMRGGLTPKHIDVPELLSVLDFTPGFGGLVEPVEQSPGVWHYPTPAPEFSLWRLVGDGTPRSIPATDAARILLVTEGAMTARSADSEVGLVRGQSALLSAGDEVTVDGIGSAFVGGPGIFADAVRGDVA